MDPNSDPLHQTPPASEEVLVALPPLPDHAGELKLFPPDSARHLRPLGAVAYTVDQLRAFARAAVLQERAKHADWLEALQTIAAQRSGIVGSTALADCMATMAAAAIRST